MRNYPIQIGMCSKAYLYILGAIFFKYLEEYIPKINIFNRNDKDYKSIVFKSHKLITYMYRNMGYIIFGFIFFYIAKRNKNKIVQKTDNKISSEKPLIYKKRFFSKNILKKILILGALFSFQSVIRRIIGLFSPNGFDLWIFNFIFTSIYMKCYFNVNIYLHQKLSLYFIFITNFILLIWLTIIDETTSLKDNNKNVSTYEYIRELYGSSGFCIIIYIIYIFLANILSLGRVLSKRLMEIEYETPYRIIFFIGIIGTLIFLITLIFTSIFKCNKNLKSICKINGIWIVYLYFYLN